MKHAQRFLGRNYRRVPSKGRLTKRWQSFEGLSQARYDPGLKGVFHGLPRIEHFNLENLVLKTNDHLWIGFWEYWI